MYSFKILIRKPKGKRPLLRHIPRYSSEDSTRMDLREIRWEGTGFVWLRIGASGRLL